MAPTIRVGDYQGTEADLGQTAEILKRDVVQKLYEEDADLTPLTQLLRRSRKVTAKSFKHEYIELQEMPLVTQINNGAGYTAGATSIVVDNGSIFGAASLAKIPRTSEVLSITSISSNTLTAARSWGTTAAAALLDNDYIVHLGGAAREGANSELGRVANETVAYNLTQIFRDPYGQTRTAKKSITHGPDNFMTKRNARGRDHKKAIELAMFFGERASETSSVDEPRRSMGGLQEFISTNSTDFGGVVTLESIFVAAQSEFRYGSTKKKLLFCARPVASNIAMLGKEHLRESKDGLKVFGIQMDELRTQHGRYVIIPCPLFEGDDYDKIAFVVDPAHVAYAPLDDTMLRRDVRANISADATKEEWLTECTMERILERTHGLWTNAA